MSAAEVVRDGPEFTGPKLESALDAAWSRPRGLIGWLASVDHKEIGARYIVTALIFLALAGAIALHMRLQLMVPGNRLMSAELYNESFTIHGTTMMFLFAVPVMQGVQIYLTPLMVGTRNMASQGSRHLAITYIWAAGCFSGPVISSALGRTPAGSRMFRSLAPNMASESASTSGPRRSLSPRSPRLPLQSLSSRPF